MEERKFKGIWIPKEIWLTNDLTLQEKVILVEIDSLDDEETGCYASNKYFSKFFNLTNGRVSQIIKSLKEKGYLDVTLHYSGNEITERVIKIKRPPYPKVEKKEEDTGVVNKLNTYLENDNRGYLENCEKNNTSLNIKENIYKRKYGEFENVLLSDTEYEKLKQQNLLNYIDTLSLYLKSKGKKYKNHYATILSWNRKEKKQTSQKEERRYL